MRHLLILLPTAFLLFSCSSTGPTKPAGESAPASAAVADEDLPQGWKTPARIRKSGCKRGSNGLFVASADFDGDGDPDSARVLAREKGKGIGVWVWLSSQEEPILASVAQHRDGKHDMGISVAQPGVYPTACGKGHWPCGDKEPAELTLERPAVDFFTCEGSNRYLHWEPAQARFATTWMSD